MIPTISRPAAISRLIMAPDTAALFHAPGPLGCSAGQSKLMRSQPTPAYEAANGAVKASTTPNLRSGGGSVEAAAMRRGSTRDAPSGPTPRGEWADGTQAGAAGPQAEHRRGTAPGRRTGPASTPCAACRPVETPAGAKNTVSRPNAVTASAKIASARRG